MDYPFHKDKIPIGSSFPLKRSVLDVFLEKARIEKISSVCFSSYSRSSGIILLASFFGEAHKGYAEAGLTSLSFYCVPSAIRKEVENTMIDSILPQLCNWLQMVEKKGNSWRGKSRHLEFRYNDGQVETREYAT